MITIQTGKCQLLLVKVPEGINNINVMGLVLHFSEESVTGENVGSFTRLPKGKWRILYNPWELTEEQWKELVPFVGLPWCAYKDYTTNKSWFNNASQSGHSLLRENKIYRVNPYAGMFTPRLVDSSNSGDLGGVLGDIIYNDLRDGWREAEERTGNWIVLIKEEE